VPIINNFEEFEEMLNDINLNARMEKIFKPPPILIAQESTIFSRYFKYYKKLPSMNIKSKL